MFDIDSIAPENKKPRGPDVVLVDKPALKSPSFIQKNIPWLIVVLVIILAGVLFAMQYLKTQRLDKQLSELKNSPQQITENETRDLIAKVSKLISLPQNEQPTIATVTDLKPLQDQPFFKNAKLNDKVLIYSIAKKAVLYRPDDNIIIEVAPLNFENTTNSSASPSVPDNSTNSQPEQ